MKRRRKHGKFVREKAAEDNPLGIGLSKKTLVWIGVGIVAAVALKLYLDKRKAAGPQVFVPPNDGRQNALDQQLAGLGAIRNPASTDAPPQRPVDAPVSAQMPQSPRPPIDDSRGGYSRSGGFSGGGDGGLGGGNGRL